MIKKNYLLLGSLFCTIMFLSACGQTAQEGTASLLQKSDYDWRTKGFTMTGEAIDSPLFMVDYEKIPYEEVPDTMLKTTCQTTDTEAFCILDTFYTSTERTYFFQRLNGEAEAERLTLSTDRWGISNGDIQKMAIVDNNQYVFFCDQ